MTSYSVPAVSPASVGLTINLIYDAAALAAPQSFRDGIQEAANILEATVTDDITLNINIDYSGTGRRAYAGPSIGSVESYDFVRSALINNAMPGDTAFDTLPSGPSFEGLIKGLSDFFIWTSQQRLFGLLDANDTSTHDGSASFSTDIDPNLLVGVALHELTHAMGRFWGGYSPNIFDFFRFTSPGTRTVLGDATYFSIDGGITKLADYGQKLDSADFLNPGPTKLGPPYSDLTPNDPFNEIFDSHTLQQLTAVDLEQLDALGFHIAQFSTDLPDLQTTGVELIGTSLAFGIANTGATKANGSVTGVYLSDDSKITTSDTQLGTNPTPSLLAGEFDDEALSIAFPGDRTRGTYWVGAIADSQHQILESNNANNASTALEIILGDNAANGILGAAGVDRIFGLAGNDRISGLGGKDIIDGGLGIDTAVYSGKTAAVVATAADLTALHVRVGGFVEDTIISIENLIGGSASDRLTGNAVANTLVGNGGDDLLQGGKGDDTLNGGAGIDKLIGGGGFDKLNGGAGNDSFIYAALGNSGTTATTRDQIFGFASGDKIDVHLIDAIAGGTDNAFVLDKNNSFSEGEIRQRATGSGHLLLEFNADADAAPEMSILLRNHSTLLTSGDFVL